MAVRADQYFWFNGVGDVDHTNWGAYWAPIISSGVFGDGGDVTGKGNRISDWQGDRGSD